MTNAMFRRGLTMIAFRARCQALLAARDEAYPRATIIALRARHSAFRMAMDILHARRPPAAPPAAQAEAAAVDSVPAIDVLAQFASWEREQRREQRQRTMRRLVVMLWVAAIVIAAWNWPR